VVLELPSPVRELKAEQTLRTMPPTDAAVPLEASEGCRERCESELVDDEHGTKEDDEEEERNDRAGCEAEFEHEFVIVNEEQRRLWRATHGLPPAAQLRPSFVWYWPSQLIITPLRVHGGSYVVKQTPAEKYPFLRCTTVLARDIGALQMPYAWDDEWRAFVTAFVRLRQSDGLHMLCTYAHPREGVPAGTMRCVCQRYVFGPATKTDAPNVVAVAIRIEGASGC
jgi:hypothetical protein